MYLTNVGPTENLPGELLLLLLISIARVVGHNEVF